MSFKQLEGSFGRLHQIAFFIHSKFSSSSQYASHSSASLSGYGSLVTSSTHCLLLSFLSVFYNAADLKFSLEQFQKVHSLHFLVLSWFSTEFVLPKNTQRFCPYISFRNFLGVFKEHKCPLKFILLTTTSFSPFLRFLTPHM